MGIDASIYQRNQQNVQLQNPIELATQAMTMKRLAQQNQAQDTALAEEAAIKDAYKRNTVMSPDGKAQVNRQAVLSDLYKTNPMKAREIEQADQKADLDKMMNQTAIAKELAWSIRDPQTYMAARQRGIELGLPNAESLPPEYPGDSFIQKMQMGTLSAEQRLAQMAKEREFEYRDKELVSKSLDRREARDERRFQAGIKMGEKREEKLEKDVQKLSDKLGNAQELGNALANVNSKLGFDLDKAEVVDGRVLVGGKSVDLPGVSVPGLGRVSAYSGKARDLQSAVAKVFNTELKDRSGAAVTTPELERLKIEFGSGKFNSESEMIGAMKSYKAMVNEELKNREAAFRPEVIQTYRERGGATSDRFKTPQQAKAFSPDVLQYAQKHGISTEQAQAIKDQRTAPQTAGR